MSERSRKSKDFDKPKAKSGGFSKGKTSRKSDAPKKYSEKSDDSYASKKRFSKSSDSPEGKSRFRSEKRTSDSYSKKDSYEKKSYGSREESDGKRSYKRKEDSFEKKSYGRREDSSERRSYKRKDDSFEKKSYGSRDESAGKRSYKRKDDSFEKKSYGRREDSSEKRSYTRKGDSFEKKSYGMRDESAGKRSYSRNEESSDKKSYKSRISFSDDKENTRPKRRFDKDDDTSTSKRTFRRFDKEEDSSTGVSGNKYNVVKKSDASHSGGKNEKHYSKDEKPVRRKRRDVNADSEILSEIVENRKRSGRLVEKPKVLSLSYEEKVGPIRLNKYIANAGICSRREADTIIESGVIMVNGVYVTELGMKVMPTDEVRYGDRVLCREKTVYLLLNKPKDYITTLEDDRGRKNVMELIAGACRERIYPVGRLDRTTTGLLLFTNDGEMARKLMHPKMGIKKVYQVELDKNLKHPDMLKIADGIELDDTFIKADSIAYINPDTKREVGIEIHSGQNRIVRRIFESLGYKVVKLDRTMYAGLTKKDLPRGRWRFLNEREVNILKMSVK